MSHRSRGCLRCRQRRVKCDKGRPACQRCVVRNEACVGYRDEIDLIFQDQTDKVAQKVQINSETIISSPSRGIRTRSKSLERQNAPITSLQLVGPERQFLPWLKHPDPHYDEPSGEKKAVTDFLHKYVIYPEGESPGFLEHLPSLFQEVHVTGRYALRWAVQAAAFADISCSEQNSQAAVKALQFYGSSLKALEKSLSPGGKCPDDYDLMTVVILDIFEELFLPEASSRGCHSQAMAHILRIRGHDQLHDPRGWGLFRLAHHRMQKERLAKHIAPLKESQEWLDELNTEMSFVQLETGSLKIAKVCNQARSVLQDITGSTSPRIGVLELVHEMHELDQEVLQWRKRPEWSYRVITKDEIQAEAASVEHFPARLEVHRDVWMAYEWNYHRTARIILHQQLLECLSRLSTGTSEQVRSGSELEILKWMNKSTAIISELSEQILSTVPQSLGEIDCLGQYIRSPTTQPRLKAIGAYFLLWPMKVIKSSSSKATESQRQCAQAIFERIRVCTGMKSHLGSLSNI